MLDSLAPRRERLNASLALPDEALIAALGGRRRESLRARHAAFAPEPSEPGRGVEAICRHDPGYPRALRGDAAPWMLNIAGGAGARLTRLTAGPLVALLGSRRASDYGREMARTLARDLTASGVTVASTLTDGVGGAAQTGVQDAGGGGIAMLGGGLGVCPTRWRTLYGSLTARGCALSELPHACPGRRWGLPAGERIAVGLAGLAVVVEARETPHELGAAHTARALGRPLAVVPGRVTSPLSTGPHALLREGASPIRDAEDILELLYREPRPPIRAGGRVAERSLALEPDLRTIIDLVGSGADTPDRLVAAGAEPSELLHALTELELRGLLARGENGRYLPRHAF
ncbi:MAG TPA: DNA-processing protein DprA [Solirubrobacteraceae bacterium]